MKVATLNYHNAYNYGAVFQAEALQSVISGLGADCDIIDYRNEVVERQYEFIKPSIKKRNIVSALRANLVLLPFITKKRKNFQKWMDDYKKTKHLKREELSKLNDIYDYFVVGSDQVWNMKCHDTDTSFLFDFVKNNNKKIAYAASFGKHDIALADRSVYEKYIPQFASISVREERGIEIVESIANAKVCCAMDPVMLVGADHWVKKATKRIISNEYIFVYQLGRGKQVAEYAHQLKKATGKNIVFVTGHIGNYIYYSFADKNYSSASPEDFLSLLINADYVVTNSFHGTVLSLLFNKKFYSVVEGDAKAAYNSRIFNVLQEYSLEGQIVNKFDVDDLQNEIKFSMFNKRFEDNRKLSIMYLRESLHLVDDH